VFAEQGTTREVESEFELWRGDWPLPEQVEVRYLPGDPTRVISEPAYASNSLYTASALGLFGLSFIVLAWYCTRQIQRKLDSMRELARSGSLMYAELIALKQTGGNPPQLQLTYRLPGQKQTLQVFAIDAAPPFLDGEREVVAASRDLGISCALRTDGYPFKLYGLTLAQQLRAEALGYESR
jgi:hypothetical protein